MRSLSTRVALSAGVVLAIFIVLSALALERAFRESARGARQERLLAQVYLLMAAAEVDGKGTLSIGSGAMEPRLDLPGSGLYAAIIDGQGSVIWKSRSSISVIAPTHVPLQAGQQRFEQRTDVGGKFFIESYGISWAVGDKSYPFTFSVAEDLRPFEQQLATYRRSLWTWLGVMAVLLVAIQWIVLRWGLNPLRRVALEIKQLQQGGKDKLEGQYPTELTLLTENLNSLLTRERAQQKRYRDALADLAHSLKTPLALIRGASSKRDENLQQTLDEQVERMDKIVSYHLQRASTSGKSTLVAPVPLRAVAERIVIALTKVYADKKIQTTVDIDERIRFRGDEGDLTEILGNLLDNACKWCRSQVKFSARVSEGRLTLQIEDDGPGIAASQTPRILERGVRLDQSTSGQGIGLAVTADIVEAYSGSISIGESTWGGAMVTLTLPGMHQ